MAGVKIKLGKRSNPFYKLQRTTKIRIYVTSNFLCKQESRHRSIITCFFFQHLHKSKEKVSEALQNKVE